MAQINQMSIFKIATLSALPQFRYQEDQIAILERDPILGANAFFEKLLRTQIQVKGLVSVRYRQKDIENLLAEEIPEKMRFDPFYNLWISDITSVCEAFGELVESPTIAFSLSTERECRRYHKDNVPLRLLLTYSGAGTEWLPDYAADQYAYENGLPNEKIIKAPEARQFMSNWDIAVFRGGPRGVLHRTPDPALTGRSILLRLDHEDFWTSVMKNMSLERSGVI